MQTFFVACLYVPVGQLRIHVFVDLSNFSVPEQEVQFVGSRPVQELQLGSQLMHSECVESIEEII